MDRSIVSVQEIMEATEVEALGKVSSPSFTGREDANKDANKSALGVLVAAQPQPARWMKQKGLRRVMAEFRAISEGLQKNPGSIGALRSLSLPDDEDLNVWRMELSGFDTDVAAGVQLNSDLEMLQSITGGAHGAHIIMEATFPPNYPAAPFFLRVVSPRMVMYTGHVTAGGSVCIEALTNGGSPGAWKPEFTVEGILNMVMQNMLYTEVVEIQTARGPGGRTGPLRVNLGRPSEYGGPAMEYSQDAAAAAFQRSIQHHSKHGW
eukprot:COSAG02_NODE_234_length_27784_cov_12.556872_15_plen_264_part_00